MFTPRTFGKYHLLEKIAVGGMAEIYKAKMVGAAGFEKLMVVKQILPQYAQDPDFVKMFIDEAKIAVSLSHGNIVPIYELGKIEGVYFIAMEYIHGKNLGEILERAHELGRQVPVELGIYITTEICKGLDYAHHKTSPDGVALNIIHRDISPQNILVSYDGEVKIVDFGIAKAIYSSQTTKAGVIKGKFGYMSPEQARGHPLDPRTDVFSAGILLFEMLTGSRLFAADSEVETLENVKMAKVPSPSRLNSKIPPMLDKIVFKALAKDPDDRYQSADEFGKALAKFNYSQGWEVSQKALARYMSDLFPADTRNGREESPRPVETIRAPEMAMSDEKTDRGGMREPKTDRMGPPREEEAEPTRRVPLGDVGTPAAEGASAGAAEPVEPRRKPVVGPPELEALLTQEEREKVSPPPPRPKPRTSPGFELAQEVPDKEPQSLLEAVKELPLGDAEILLQQPGTGREVLPPSEPTPAPEPKRSLAVPVLVVTIVVLLGVIGLLLAKFAPTLSPAEKKRRAEAEQRRLLEERDRKAPVYGRVEFFIEPVAVDFHWNGQKHPESPTKHVMIQDLDVKEVYRVKLEVPRKPGETAMMWYPKEITITPGDWKVVEGIHVFRQHINLDPTPENKEAIRQLEEDRKAREAVEKKRRKRRRE